MKFYCDEMLGKLGRWLRTAGYDTRLVGNSLSDREILNQAISEQRILLSRDRKLAEFKIAKNVVVLLDCKTFNECVREVTNKLQINWLLKPFSRCIKCNAVLIPADVTQLRKVPEDFKNNIENICYCSHCNQVYWPGGHVKRMQNKLMEFTGYSCD